MGACGLAIYPLSAHKKKDFDSKQSLRSYARSLGAYHCSYANRALCAYLESLIAHHGFKRIALFYPMCHEPNILPLLKKLKKSKNIQIFLPAMRGLKVKMLPYRLPLVRNHFGIYEPSGSGYVYQQVDFVLIPSLGIDIVFGRIGMGKGVYDRSFASKSKLPYRAFVSQNLLIANNHITQEFDINAHEYISYTAVVKNIRGFYNVDSHRRVFRVRASCRARRLSSV